LTALFLTAKFSLQKLGDRDDVLILKGKSKTVTMERNTKVIICIVSVALLVMCIYHFFG